MFFKRAFPLFLVCCLLIAGTFATAHDKPEFRAMWVSSYGSSADICTPQGIDRLIAHAKLANLNAIVIQVRKTGDAFYKSDTEPRAEDLEGQPADWDPLAYIIEKAHAQGLEVHAWLNTYKIWVGDTPPKDPNHVFNKHPEWVNKTIDGRLDKSNNYGLDPGIREAQEYICNTYLEVVRKYDVDGVHFDYCRYWDPTFGYSDLAVARFNKETGRTGKPKVDDPVWCQWRRDRVTDLVRQVYEGVQATKPWVRVTASVVGNHPEGPLPMDFTKSHPYFSLLQDWERWTREGIIDAVFPMNYKRETSPQQQVAFREMTDGMVRWKHDRHAYNGMSVQPPDDYAAQVNESRTRGTDGTCGFAFNGTGRYSLTNVSRVNFDPRNFERGNFPGGNFNRSNAGRRAPNRAGFAGNTGRGGFAPSGPGRSSARARMALALRQKVFQTWVPTPPMPWKAARPSGGPDVSAQGKIALDSAIYSGGMDGAIYILREAIVQDPTSADAHYRLGRLLLIKNLKAEAQAEFSKALEFDPSHAGALAEI